ncbi:MAG TPA: class I SAM-dependent methyltransferase [Solirubrobacteraceae bacterium]|nr:class I SAM-dependent methyltransferase [Solirubrobacteraceae bacterium]
MNARDRLGRLAPTPRPRGPHTDAHVDVRHARDDGGLDYYDGVVVGAEAIGALACEPATLDEAMALVARQEGDDYVSYVREFVGAGRRAGGEAWRFADITTALLAAARLLRPRSYLEIGVRRGRSMGIVAATAPECEIVGVDMWMADYAGMENPGPELVREQMARLGHRGRLELLSGDSHRVVPRLFAQRRDLSFDLITVDGDHSVRGAARDLAAVLPRLRVGGALVFDDMRHPYHPALVDVWRRVVAADRRYATWQFDEIGYGVAVAVRRW